uniref:Calponin-homology (CH) domain-containing protein n=1 Tax=Castor canadensis TaxID=51338 RepID=A0A8C0W1C4_CASCN
MPGAARPSPAVLLPPPPGALRCLCSWLDRLPLSRPKRHLARDFSDGVLVAEIVKHFHPRLVDLHNYIPACSTDQKLSNWSLLNRKVFHKLQFCIAEADIHKVVANVPGAIEPILCALKEKVEARTVHADSHGIDDPGLSSVDAARPWRGLTTQTHASKTQTSDVGKVSLSDPPWTVPWLHQCLELMVSLCHAGLQSPPAPSSLKTLQNQKTGCCGGWDSVEGPWEQLARVQQQLEDKEQALAILQETVKILQMKVVRLEHLVKLKDLRIGELMRPGANGHQIPGAARPKSAKP